MFSNKSLLITGGTGSFGKAFSKYLLQNYKIKRLVIFSRDELKQFEMQNEEIFIKYKKNLRFFIGDIRDFDRLNYAFDNIDIVVHAAALKQVLASEYNPFETIKTNIIGAQNIITAAMNKKVKKVIALSTDKACTPINLYGASKLCAEKLFINANKHKGGNEISFSALRYGNVNKSRGSVIPLFKKLSEKKKVLPVTDISMTRFSINMQEALEMVIWGIKNFKGGEILVPKIPSYKLMDLVKALNSNYKIVGAKQGEKLHEDLISESESLKLLKGRKYYLILDNLSDKKLLKFYADNNFKINKVKFNYNSGKNNDFLSVTEIKNIISRDD